jgi:hypothetical protein
VAHGKFLLEKPEERNCIFSVFLAGNPVLLQENKNCSASPAILRRQFKELVQAAVARDKPLAVRGTPLIVCPGHYFFEKLAERRVSEPIFATW